MKNKLFNLSCLILPISIASLLAIKHLSQPHFQQGTNLQEDKIIEFEDISLANTQTDITINEANVYTISTMNCLVEDVSDPNVMTRLSQYTAIVRIDSIDGGDNYSTLNESYVLPYTYGKMTVIQSLRGELPENQTLEFYRLGGTVSMDQYYDSLYDSEKANFDEMSMDDAIKNADFIKVFDAEDVRPEVGKTYLVYLKDETVYHGIPGTYAIIGLQGGLREVQAADSEIQAYSASPVKVLNNFTGEWESLADIISVDESL